MLFAHISGLIDNTILSFLPKLATQLVHRAIKAGLIAVIAFFMLPAGQVLANTIYVDDDCSFNQAIQSAGTDTAIGD